MPSDAHEPAPAPPSGRGIARRAIVGALTTSAGTLLGFALRFVSNFLLARYLLPEQYGTYGLAAVYAAFAGLPYSLSFAQALVQLGPEQGRLFGTVRAMSLWLVAASVPLSLGAAYVASRLHGATAGLAVLGLGAGQALAAISSVYEGTLHRAMRYELVALLRVTTVAVSTALTVVLALWTGSTLVLVLRDVAPPALTLLALLAYLASGRRRAELGLESGVDRATAARVWQLGRAILLNRAFEVAVNRFDSLAVGLVLGERSLGYFEQAKYIAGLPGALIAPFGQTIALRTFTAVRDDEARLRRAVELLQWAVARVGVLFAVGCVVAPELVIRLVFGPGWEPSAAMLRYFALWVVVTPLATNLQVLFMSLERWWWIRASLVVNAVVLPLALLPALLSERSELAPLGNGLAYLATLLVLTQRASTLRLARLRGLLVPALSLLIGGVVGLVVLSRLEGTPSFGSPHVRSSVGLVAALAATLLSWLALEGRAIATQARYLVDLVRRRG